METAAGIEEYARDDVEAAQGRTFKLLPLSVTLGDETMMPGQAQGVQCVRTAIQIISALLAALVVFFISNLLVGSVLKPPDDLPSLPFDVAPTILAIAAGWMFWRLIASPRFGWLRAILVGSFVTGALAFLLGFVGPILLMPDSNQGPLIGIFVTGPMGFLLGGIGGLIYWWVAGSKGRSAA